MKRLLKAIQAGWQAARDAWSSHGVNERLDWAEFDLELQIRDLEKLRDVAADRFGQESELFRQINEGLKNGDSEEMDLARRRFIKEAYEYLPPDIAPF